MKNLILFTIAIGIMSCNRTEKVENGENVADVSITEIADCNIKSYSELFDSIRLIRLETNEKCLIGRIDKVLYYNNAVLILDKIIAKSVLMFDKDGNFLRKVGKIGRGPGEHISPADMNINPYTKEILIYDNAKSAIAVYGFDGEFHREFQLENRTGSFAVLDEDKYALYFNYNKNEEINVLPKHNLHIIDGELNILNKGFDRTNSHVPNLEGTNSFSLSRGTLLFHPSFANRIYKISANSIIPEYNFDFGELTLTENFINTVTSEANTTEEAISAIDYGGKVYIRDFSQTDNYIILNVVHDHLVKNVFYSKQTGKVKMATVLFNDMYGLIPGLNDFYGFEGDIAISYIIPHQVPLQHYKMLLNGSIKDAKFISNELLQNLNDLPMEEKCLNSIRELLDTMTYTATARENSEIKGLTEESNPVLFLLKIKKF